MHFSAHADLTPRFTVCLMETDETAEVSTTEKGGSTHLLNAGVQDESLRSRDARTVAV